MSGGLETANRLLKQRGIIILISDFMADPDRYARLLRTTNQRHDLIALHLHDPLEAMIPKVGLLAMEDAETGRVVTVDTADPAWRATAEQQFRHRDHRLRRLFTQAQVDRIIIPTGRPYVRPLIRFFAQRIRRR